MTVMAASDPTRQPDRGAVRSDFFVLRSPLLPYDELAAWSAGLEAPAALDEPANPTA